MIQHLIADETSMGMYNRLISAKLWTAILRIFFLVFALALFTVTIPAHAVYVKYRGEVDIYNGHFRPFPLKPSSFVHRIHYDENNRYLVVKLSHTYYHYCRIPDYVVEMWVSASSLGIFYNRHIKGNYDCRLGGIPIY